MTIINNTISFAPQIQNEAIEWVKNIYVALFTACPIVERAQLLQIEKQGDTEDCFALQIHFSSQQNYNTYKEKYAADFDQILGQKFQNTMGIFTTVLHEV